MSLGLVHKRELHKRRIKRFWGLTKFVLSTVLCSCIGYYAYEVGMSISKEEVLIWKSRYEAQVTENDKLKIELGNERATVDQISQQIPNQENRNLLNIVTKRANEGVDISRMETILNGISKDAKCLKETDTKRFSILTPISTEGLSTASFYRGLITLSGRGSPTLNENGNPEDWFDTAKAITVSFVMPGGNKREITSTLPLYHSVVSGGSEYRFSITSGRTSYVNASVQQCEL